MTPSTFLTTIRPYNGSDSVDPYRLSTHEPTIIHYIKGGHREFRRFDLVLRGQRRTNPLMSSCLLSTCRFGNLKFQRLERSENSMFWTRKLEVNGLRTFVGPLLQLRHLLSGPSLALVRLGEEWWGVLYSWRPRQRSPPPCSFSY